MVCFPHGISVLGGRYSPRRQRLLAVPIPQVDLQRRRRMRQDSPLARVYAAGWAKRSACRGGRESMARVRILRHGAVHVLCVLLFFLTDFFFYELHPLLFFCCQSSESPNFKYLSESPAFLLFSFVVKSIFCAYFRYWCGTMQTMFLRLTIRQW